MKLTEKFIEKFLADFHYELTREQLEQDWTFDTKPFYKEKNAWCFRAPDNCWLEIDINDVNDAFVGGVDFESLHGDGNKSDYEYKVMGTVEPRFNDSRVFLSEDTFICDEPLAFIYGAIKKYGTDKAYLEALKEYIIREAKLINTYTVEGV